jgi:hypothetical protein
VVIAVYDSAGVSPPEIPLECPVMGETEGNQRIGCGDSPERNDVSTVVRTSDAGKRIAGDGTEVGETEQFKARRVAFGR